MRQDPCLERIFRVKIGTAIQAVYAFERGSADEYIRRLWCENRKKCHHIEKDGGVSFCMHHSFSDGPMCRFSICPIVNSIKKRVEDNVDEPNKDTQQI